MPTFRIKRNDTRPFLTATLFDGDGAAVDLTGASATFLLADNQGDLVFEKTAVVEPDQVANRGGLRYEWEAGDLATVGTYRGEFEVTFTDATKQSFPTRGHIWVKVHTDLENA